MARVAGVDSSTQSVKIVVRDSESGALLAQASRPHPDGTEVDPQHWLDALHAVIAEIGGLESLAAISIGGQQHGMVLRSGYLIHYLNLGSLTSFTCRASQ